MSRGVLIPSLGGPQLAHCLAAASQLDPPADHLLVVLSGRAAAARSSDTDAEGVTFLRLRHRLGFAAAVNAGLRAMPEEVELIALLNDDAVPAPHWWGTLLAALEQEPQLAAVQGTISDADGRRIDGRGIMLDRYGLAVQVDRGDPVPVTEQLPSRRHLLAVSGTAVLLRRQALHQAALANGDVFDQRFGSYYEDLDLGLRLRRCGWQAAWIGGAPCRHVGSVTGRRLLWRHPWWLLVNRWRALAGNLTPWAWLRSLPRLLRGELRAVRALARSNPRALLVAPAVLLSLPVIVVTAWCRPSPGPRLRSLAGGEINPDPAACLPPAEGGER